MGLLSKFKFGSKTSAPAPSAAGLAEASEIVREARVKARRRLIGASLLLGAGIIGFPLVFESRPRPIPVDIPIEIPAREGMTPLAPPVPRVAPIGSNAPAAASATKSEGDVPASSALGDHESIVPSSGGDAQAREAPPAAAVVAPFAVAGASLARQAASAPAAAPAARKRLAGQVGALAASASQADAKPAPAKSSTPAAATAVAPSAARPAASAASKGRSADGAVDQGRYVVQIGAFAEVPTAHAARMKVEALGLKTYTQVIESPSGRRIRVRVGPFATKADAAKAATRIKNSGLPAAVLTL